MGSDWFNVLINNEVDSAWKSFKTFFISVLDENATVKCVRIKQRTEAWIDSDVLKCIKDRDTAFNVYKRNRTDENFLAFRNLRNKAQKCITNAKKSFISSVVSYYTNFRFLWDHLKQLGLPSKKGQSTYSIRLNTEGEICFDHRKVADRFNSF